ncbi:beta-propeller fold lactonase family protein [Micromonospora sp. NPDC023737]|uniref:lactonase family protein n=1 Tax=unclassified Micromonospora TaxID=2617518 RepID=UPI0034039FE6
MGTTARITSVAGVALTAGALLAGPASAAPAHHDRSVGSVFVQTDNTAGNAIVAYDRSSDGRLRQAGTYLTGGLGGILGGSVADHLASQGSLTYDRTHKLLYAVNAGSDTITVFQVHGDRLTRRQVISSGGTFPVSVATIGNTVYVLNARDGGSVQGFRRVGHTLVRIPAWHRKLGLDPTLTPEFTHSPAQVAFTPDGRKLLVTTMGNGSNIDIFDVHPDGGISTQPVVNHQPDKAPFAVAFDSRGHLLVAEAGPNAVASYTINRDNTLKPLDEQATGQAATCWIVITGDKAYTSNAGSGSLSGYRVGAKGSLTALGNTTTNPGTVDAAVSPDGHFLYVQTGVNGTVDAFRINPDGSLTATGSTTVPNAVGGEGIVVS